MMDVMTDKKNKWLARNMKQQDILPSHRTEGLYIPARKTMADMDDAFLRKQQCHMSGGDLSVCATCAAPCTVGRLLMERGKGQ